MTYPLGRIGLATACLMTPALTACQTRPAPSSLVIEDAVTDLRASMCEALKPTQITEEDFLASPPMIRAALAKDAEAWVEVCQ